MGIIFFFVITPIALLMKVMKDLLNLKFNSKNVLDRKNRSESSMKNQF